MNEIVEGVLDTCVAELHLKKVGTHIQHTLFWIELPCTHADSIDEMRFSATRWAIDEHGIELCRLGMLGNGKSYRTRQLVTIAFDIIREGLPRIQL